MKIFTQTDRHTTTILPVLFLPHCESWFVFQGEEQKHSGYVRGIKSTAEDPTLSLFAAYSQQDATFLKFIYFCKTLYMLPAASSR